jgi:general secretion pathway protein J
MRAVRTGFTLIEVMVALAIMALIATLAWTTLASAADMRNYLEMKDEANRTARNALNRLTKEISLAFLTDNTAAINTYETIFVGRDQDDTDSLWFATKGHRRSYRNARECDQAEVTVWTDTDPENPNRYVLLHRESERIDEEPEQDGAILPLATGVTRFDLSYLDPTTGEWQDEWDTTGTETPNRLPRAVQVVLQLMTPDPEGGEDDVESTFVRTIVIEMADAQTQSLFASGSGKSSL